MSSILTNNSAMVALQTLKAVNSNLSATQNEISTGKSVGNAKDNAAIWAISKVMESDVESFKGVSDSLSLGQSTIAVARQGSETVTDLLTQMKTKIVAAQEENVDRGKIQDDIEALREQITNVVGAAQFNGLNMLDGTSTDDVEVLASLNRASDGTVSATKIDVARQNLSVTGPVSSQVFGATDYADAAAANAMMQSGALDTVEDDTAFDPASPLATIADGATLDVDIKSVDRGASYQITLDNLNLNVAGGGTTLGLREFEYVASENDGTQDVANALAAQMNAFFDAATTSAEGYSAAVAVESNGDARITITNAAGGDATAIGVGLRMQDDGTPGETASATGLSALSTIDVNTDAVGALTAIDGMIDTAIDAAASLGSSQMQLETQASFISQLTDSLKSGIGSLVDADMEEASAKLQALQVQQQLAVQALSIANQAPQSILSLFR